MTSAIIGVVTMVKAGGGFIRDAAGVSYWFTSNDAQLRPNDRVEFDPDGPRFGRWFARNVTRSTSTTTTSKGATT